MTPMFNLKTRGTVYPMKHKDPPASICSTTYRASMIECRWLDQNANRCTKDTIRALDDRYCIRKDKLDVWPCVPVSTCFDHRHARRQEERSILNKFPQTDLSRSSILCNICISRRPPSAPFTTMTSTLIVSTNIFTFIFFLFSMKRCTHDDGLSCHG